MGSKRHPVLRHGGRGCRPLEHPDGSDRDSHAGHHRLPDRRPAGCGQTQHGVRSRLRRRQLAGRHGNGRDIRLLRHPDIVPHEWLSRRESGLLSESLRTTRPQGAETRHHQSRLRAHAIERRGRRRRGRHHRGDGVALSTRFQERPRLSRVHGRWV